jgi:hypothetical protein
MSLGNLHTNGRETDLRFPCQRRVLLYDRSRHYRGRRIYFDLVDSYKSLMSIGLLQM